MSELEPELPIAVPADPAPPAEPVAADPAPATPEPVAPAPVNWEDMNVLSEAAARLQQLGYNLVPATPEQQPENVLPEYDPYNPQAYFDAREEQLLSRIAEQFSPVQQFVASEQDQRVESTINTQIDQLKSELGYTGDNLELRALADRFAPDMVAKHGQTPAAGRAAIQAAIEHAKTRDDQIRQQAVEEYKESLTRPRDPSTPYEPGVRGVGRLDEHSFASEADVARSWRDRQPV